MGESCFDNGRFTENRRWMWLTPAVVGGSFSGDELGGIGCGRM